MEYGPLLASRWREALYRTGLGLGVGLLILELKDFVSVISKKGILYFHPLKAFKARQIFYKNGNLLFNLL